MSSRIKVAVSKESPHDKVGVIFMQESDDAILVNSISPTSLFANTRLEVGMEILSINDVSTDADSGINFGKAMRMLRDAEDVIEIVAHEAPTNKYNITESTAREDAAVQIPTGIVISYKKAPAREPPAATAQESEDNPTIVDPESAEDSYETPVPLQMPEDEIDDDSDMVMSHENMPPKEPPASHTETASKVKRTVAKSSSYEDSQHPMHQLVISEDDLDEDMSDLVMLHEQALPKEPPIARTDAAGGDEGTIAKSPSYQDSHPRLQLVISKDNLDFATSDLFDGNSDLGMSSEDDLDSRASITEYISPSFEDVHQVIISEDDFDGDTSDLVMSKAKTPSLEPPVTAGKASEDNPTMVNLPSYKDSHPVRVVISEDDLDSREATEEISVLSEDMKPRADPSPSRFDPEENNSGKARYRMDQNPTLIVLSNDDNRRGRTVESMRKPDPDGQTLRSDNVDTSVQELSPTRSNTTEDTEHTARTSNANFRRTRAVDPSITTPSICEESTGDETYDTRQIEDYYHGGQNDDDDYFGDEGSEFELNAAALPQDVVSVSSDPPDVSLLQMEHPKEPTPVVIKSNYQRAEPPTTTYPNRSPRAIPVASTKAPASMMKISVSRSPDGIVNTFITKTKPNSKVGLSIANQLVKGRTLPIILAVASDGLCVNTPLQKDMTLFTIGGIHCIGRDEAIGMLKAGTGVIPIVAGPSHLVAATVIKARREARVGISLRRQPDVGLLVDSIAPNGLFAHTEIKLGMKILLINGQRTAGLESAEVFGIISQAEQNLTLVAEPIDKPAASRSSRRTSAGNIPQPKQQARSQQQRGSQSAAPKEAAVGIAPTESKPPSGAPTGGDWGTGTTEAAVGLCSCFGNAKAPLDALYNSPRGRVYDTRGKCVGSTSSTHWQKNPTGVSGPQRL